MVDQIRKIQINDDLWVAFQPDKMMLGGSFLPPSTHLTVSFGLRSGVTDIHLTRNLSEGRKLHLSFLEVHNDEIPEVGRVLGVALVRFFLEKLRPVNLEDLHKSGHFVVVMRPSDAKFNALFLGAFKPHAPSTITHKGKGLYKVSISEAKINEFIKPLIGENLDGPLLKRIAEKTRSPMIMEEFEKGVAMLFGPTEVGLLFRFPSSFILQKSQLLSRRKLERLTDDLLDDISRTPIGQEIVSRWSDAKSAIASAQSQASLDEHEPLRILSAEIEIPVDYPMQ